MAEENGLELIQGRGNQVCFDASCPECGGDVKECAWVERNAFLTHIQCPVCGYDKVTTTKLAEEGSSGIDADIEIRRSLMNLALSEYRAECEKCGYISLSNDHFPISCSKCKSEDVKHSYREGNVAMLIWLMEKRHLYSDS